MKNVLFRELIKEDYPQIRRLISEAFGINTIIKCPKTLDTVLNIYMQNCILESSFSRVAVKQGVIIGIILGNAKNDKNKIRKPHNIFSYISSILKLAFFKKENKNLIKEFRKVSDTYKEIICGKEESFQGCIQLFIVSKESRGLGVGKALVSNLFDYMHSMDVQSLYLYTDTNCNYGFYESQNFKRINEKDVYFDSFKQKLSVFLYSYILD